MIKGTFVSDTFEQLAELGKLPVQKNSQRRVKATNEEQEHKEKSNYTVLDVHTLRSHYKKKDDQQIEEVRRTLRHYFDLQKSEEKKAVEARKKEEKERMKMIEEETQKKKKEEERKKQGTPLPKGKERKNIFSPKKVAKRSQVETRVGSGKQ